MNVSELLRVALQDSEYVLNQYDEIVRKGDYVTIGAIVNNLIGFTSGRSRKLEQLYLSALLAKVKERYSAKISSQTRVANKQNTSLSILVKNNIDEKHIQ